jgi:NAD(P)-dependent dehydrogenase (short-subunit alcohol dehydrogenase family)
LGKRDDTVVIGKAENIPISASLPGQNGTTDEIAKAVAFLVSDESSYITGIKLLLERSGPDLRNNRHWPT